MLFFVYEHAGEGYLESLLPGERRVIAFPELEQLQNEGAVGVIGLDRLAQIVIGNGATEEALKVFPESAKLRDKKLFGLRGVDYAGHRYEAKEGKRAVQVPTLNGIKHLWARPGMDQSVQVVVLPF
jgi:hypothetical protein